MSVFREKHNDVPVRYFSTWQAWLAGVNNPSDETYKAIISDPQASSERAFTWIAGAAIVAAIISVLDRMLSGTEGQLTWLICLIPVSPVLAIIGMLILVSVVNILAKAMDGQGTFDELIYGFAAIQSPLAIVIAVLQVLPGIGGSILVIFACLYLIYLNLVMTKVVYQFSLEKAIVAYFAFIILIFGLLEFIA